MIRGREMEPIARSYYEKHYSTVQQVGFVTNEFEGITVRCSPDGLVGEHGLIEIKSRNSAIIFKEILSGKVPKENMPQIQFQLIITDREW